MIKLTGQRQQGWQVKGGHNMNGSKGNAAFNASDMPDGHDNILSLNAAQRMLPLVQRVVEDILADRKALEGLAPEQARLDRHKRDLVWQERQRRYQLQEEAATVENHMDNAVEELHTLGLKVLEPDVGRIGFPTLVNDRRAFFSWQPGEETLHSWQFAEETVSRPIPPQWWEVEESSVSGRN
jgi:hypothetical protein